MIINIEKILLFGEVSYGQSQIYTGSSMTDKTNLNIFTNQALLSTIEGEILFDLSAVSFVALRRAPGIIKKPYTVLKKINCLGEASFSEVKLVQASQYNLPSILPDQLTFVADERFYLAPKSTINSIWI